MLSRTAESLFWLARYLERAENNARLVDMGNRMAALPASAEVRAHEWASVVISAGVGALYPHLFEKATQTTVARYLLLDPENPSSVYSCFAQARRNARAVRTALTSDMWEAINDSWIHVQQQDMAFLQGGALADFIDWVRARGALFRGFVDSAMQRDEGYDFLRLGTCVERADSTTRLLDVKYHVLQPEWSGVGGIVDKYQWISILRAASSLRGYHRTYDGSVTAWGVVEFLTLNPTSPRSLAFSYECIHHHLERLKKTYGAEHACNRDVEAILDSLSKETIDTIFAHGLHEFLASFMAKNNSLSARIGEAYGFGSSAMVSQAGTEA
ncbi:MAG: alpha-E domain-containing protein [Alphaproteobacteria bacterium]